MILKKYNKLLSWIFVLVYLVFLEFILFYPDKYIWVVFGFLGFMLICSFLDFIYDYFDSFLVGIFLISLSLFYFLFVEGILWQQFFIGLNSLVLFNIIDISEEKSSSRNMFYKSALIYILFLFYSAIFKLLLIWDISTISLASFIGLISSLIFYTRFYLLENYTILKSLYYSILFALIVIELFWVLCFFPTIYWVNSGVLTLFTYFFVETLVKYKIVQILPLKPFLKALFVLILVIFMLFLTATWY